MLADAVELHLVEVLERGEHRLGLGAASSCGVLAQSGDTVSLTDALLVSSRRRPRRDHARPVAASSPAAASARGSARTQAFSSAIRKSHPADVDGSGEGELMVGEPALERHVAAAIATSTLGRE